MKRILLPLVCLVLSLVVSGCSFGERNNASDRKKVQFVTELAEICLEHYESGDCELNQIIKPYQIQRWCDPEDYLYNYIDLYEYVTKSKAYQTLKERKYNTIRVWVDET